MCLAARCNGIHPHCLTRRLAPTVLCFVAASAAVVAQTGAGGREWTLELVLDAALSQQPLIEAARARANAVRSERLAATVWPNPVATIWMENTGFGGQQLLRLNREISAYVTWPLETLVQRSARIRRADEDIRASEASVTVARRQVAANAVRAFYRVAVAQEVAAEAEHERGMLDQLNAYNSARVDEGVTAELELMRLHVERDRAATNLVFAEVDLARSVAELAPHLGIASAAPGVTANLRVVVPDDKPSSRPALIPPFDAVLARARERRPEILAGRARVAALRAAGDQERVSVVRQIGATIGSKRVEGQNSLLAGAAVAVPLFNRNQSGVARATSEYLVAEQELAWMDRAVDADVQSAHASASALTRQLGELRPSFLARADEVQQLTLGAYQEGGATLLQVLDATRMLADAHLTFVRLLCAQRQALFELALATGVEPGEALDLVRTWEGSVDAPAPTGGAQ
jgi:cobalt-zinc-cadmium efflux system outer membrane protein